MIDSFLKVAYDESVKTAEQDALVAILKKLPDEVLYKLASGQDCLPVKLGGEGLEWLEQFKDSPLFQKAVELEQQCIQIETMRQAECEKNRAEQENQPKYWEMEDKIRLQKKMLGLELAMSQLQQQTGGAAGAPNPMSPPSPAPAQTPPAGEQGAGAMGDAGPPKVASAEEMKMASEQVTLAITMGQKLAHADARKADHFQAGRGLGEIMAKTAFDANTLKSLGQKAVGAFEANPMATLGGALGAVGGLAHGAKKDEHGQRHLGAGLAEGLAGGAAGAAAGHVAGGAHHLMGQGLSPAEAVGTAGRALGNQAVAAGRNAMSQAQPAAQGLLGRIKPMLGG